MAHIRNPLDPYHPIIYVRGYAMTDGTMEATVNTPYMGFNEGSTRIRQQHDRSYQHYIFESPLIRLMKEYGYQDAYLAGLNLAEPTVQAESDLTDAALPPRCVIIHRYYESAAPETQGQSARSAIPEAARRLSRLIARVKTLVEKHPDAAKRPFKVYLVAHSMGGLICRCLLQNQQCDEADVAQYVDKVFTYGTPHNGIEMLGMNVPRVLGLMDINNFNRARMADYLDCPLREGRIDHLNERFPESRFFCLVGTNPQDYNATRWFVEKASDGLVTIDNAVIQGAPRAFSYTSHSGPFGMVNSREGYDNLVRFLFGDFTLMLRMVPEVIPLAPGIRRAYDNNAQVRGSYYFECSAYVRGNDPVPLSARRVEHRSAIFRTFDELLRPENVGLSAPRFPVLASIFLDSRRIEVGKTMVLAVDIEVSSTDFRIDGVGISAQRVPNERLFRQQFVLKITLDDDAARIRYLDGDEQWGDARGRDVENDDEGSYIPIRNKKGFSARLYIDLSPWNTDVSTYRSGKNYRMIRG